MKTQLKLSILAFSFLVSASVSAGGPTRTAFEGHIHFCDAAIPEDVIFTPSGTAHLRGGTNVNQWETGNSLIDGMEINIPNINFGLGAGSVRLDMTLYPDAVDGTWEIVQILNFHGNGTVSVHGAGHGTGELQGMAISFTVADPTFAPDNPCTAANPSAPVTGVIRN